MADGYRFNAFRVMADVSHTASKCILIWAIHSNSSAEGVSLITQALYALVFCTRYYDLFFRSLSPFVHGIPLLWWNFALKLFYIGSSLWILWVMLRWYARTHERERAWRLGAACLGGSLLLAPFAMLALAKRERWSYYEFQWTFSIVLESVCVLPQLLLLRQTDVPTVLDSFYLVALGAYRLLYILNWVYRAAAGQGHNLSLTSIVFGALQTALYLDFAWVYWGRQRVKLRHGAVVDADDWRRAWVLDKLLGRAAAPPAGGAADIEGGGGRGAGDGDAGAGAGAWGRRGVSVSADEDGPPRPRDAKRPAAAAAREPGARPEEAARILHDSDEDDASDDEGTPAPRAAGAGNEWATT